MTDHELALGLGADVGQWLLVFLCVLAIAAVGGRDDDPPREAMTRRRPKPKRDA